MSRLRSAGQMSTWKCASRHSVWLLSCFAQAYDKQGNVFSSLEGLQSLPSAWDSEPFVSAKCRMLQAAHICAQRFRWRIGDESILQRPKLVDSVGGRFAP